MPIPTAPVHFWLAPRADRDLAALRALDPARDAARLVRGVEVWIVGTYVRLARAGADVTLGDTLPAGGVVVFHAGEKRAMRAALAARADAAAPLVLVAVRGDLNAVTYADVEILQNPLQADGMRRVAVPHWPQPGLVPRDAHRGDEITVIAYKGDVANLDPWFTGPTWRDGLASLGVTWRVDGVDAPDAGTRWADFRAVDLVLAVRPPASHGYRHKPASKLQNAWLAGAPAICGVEAPLRALRRDGLDYVEVASPPEALDAVRVLVTDRTRYAAMRARAAERAREVDDAATLDCWRTLLDTTLPAIIAARGDAWFAASARRRRAAWRTARRVLRLDPRR